MHLRARADDLAEVAEFKGDGNKMRCIALRASP